MSIDVNTFIKVALEAMKEHMQEANNLVSEICDAYPYAAYKCDMDKLAEMLRVASDSVEIFQNYDGQYDRIGRWCWGNHPGRYEVQCRLCEVQRLCSEETACRLVEGKTAPEVEEENRKNSRQEE